MNLSRRPRLLLFVFLGSVLLTCRPSLAADLTGSLTGDLYTYTDSTETHVRSYVRLRSTLTAWRPDNNHFLRVQSSLRWRTDLADQLSGDPQLYIYETYGHLRTAGGKLDSYLGRQFVYSSIGSALLDGGLIRFRGPKRLDVEAYAGSSVANEDPETVTSLNDRLTAGGRLSGRPDDASRVNIAWMLRRRDGQDSFHRVGVDAYRWFGTIEAYTRYSFNIINRNSAEILGRVAFRQTEWYGSLEYQWREPSVPANSIFAIVDYQRYQVARLELSRNIRGPLAIVTTLQTTFIEGDDVFRSAVGVRAPQYSLMWIHQSGYAGVNNGLRGSAHVSIRRRWQVYASVNIFRYRIQPEYDQRSDAYNSSLGLRCRAGRGVSFEIEGQYLRNAVYRNDSRFFLRVTKDFAFRASRGGTS